MDVLMMERLVALDAQHHSISTQADECRRGAAITRIECYGTSVAPYTTDLRNNALLSEPIVHAIVHRIGSRNLFRVPLHCSNDSPDRFIRTIIVAANVAARSDR